MSIEKISLESGKAKRSLLAMWVDVQKGSAAATEEVWEPIAPIVAASVEEANKAAQKRVEKYTEPVKKVTAAKAHSGQ